MAQKNFRKEDFEDGSFGRYHIEYKKGEIGEGSNLIVEKKISRTNMKLYRLKSKDRMTAYSLSGVSRLTEG
ncbi:hypothetical protein ODZ84_02440 [Chryseobacterium fluminis]|uniref:hypothetical protein n=1 Tax=Chryseobacterium fluminis TaxID=2983606 RepID=UPI00225C1073|nr:hypothetical protein [Chryseobacterium sp. MMS21-Ot14]UZT98449.1 hypothetical protein ODZ84_02440 [Chryseobacterium sp. MMS21-Ot14]